MNVKQELEKLGCIRVAHFLGTQGKHLAGYCNIDPLMPHVDLVNKLTKKLVEHFKDDNVETVVAPGYGAVPLAHLGAQHLMTMTGKKVHGVWADKTKPKENEPKSFVFEREGFIKAVKGKRVLMLEDMINQMFSIKKLKEVIEQAGGKIVGGGSIAANRGVDAKGIGIPKFVRLAEVFYETWLPAECAKVGLCAQKAPMVEDIGHGEKFKAENPNYEGGFIKLLI